MHEILKEGKGAAFYASPSHGIIEPFAEVRIDITSYNNLVGHYKDNLVCEIGDWIRHTIPISLGVDGVPIKFSGAQLVAKKNMYPVDCVNFGTQLVQLGRNPNHTNSNSSVGDISVSIKKEVEFASDNLIIEPDFSPKENISMLADVTNKLVQVENQSPREIILTWTAYIKRNMEEFRNISDSSVDSSDPKESESTDLNKLMKKEYMVKDLNTFPCPISVSPSPTRIEAFKTIPFTLSFCASNPGSYTILLVANVNYVLSNGSLSPSPSDTNNETTKGIHEAHKLPKVRRVRLLAKAKVIQPVLELEDEDKIWFKSVERQVEKTLVITEDENELHQNAEALMNGRSQSVWVTRRTEPIIKKIITMERVLSTNSHFVLKNVTDSQCFFRLSSEPQNSFHILRTDQSGTPNNPNTITTADAYNFNYRRISENGKGKNLSELFSLNPTETMGFMIRIIDTNSFRNSLDEMDIKKVKNLAPLELGKLKISFGNGTVTYFAIMGEQ
jgi:hypothetical protein